MIRRPPKVTVPTPAQRLARERSDFTAEGAPAPAAVPAAPPPVTNLAHGPAQRKRWPR